MTARIHYREPRPGKSYPCPDAHPLTPHDLIPHPEHPGAYVCPHEYSVELSDRQTAAERETEAGERQERAEQIAAAHHAALIIQMEGAGIRITTELDSMTRGALVRAALHALTETENAR